jgi:hypothetical protein
LKCLLALQQFSKFLPFVKEFLSILVTLTVGFSTCCLPEQPYPTPQSEKERQSVTVSTSAISRKDQGKRGREIGAHFPRYSHSTPVLPLPSKCKPSHESGRITPGSGADARCQRIPSISRMKNTPATRGPHVTAGQWHLIVEQEPGGASI